MKKKIKEKIEENGFKLSDKQIADFLKYAMLLKEWNNRMNLTTLINDDEIIYKHFLDSLLCLKINVDYANKKIIDIGTGAGFPGIPLKIMNIDTSLTLLDATKKRIEFLSHVIAELKLNNVNCLHARAEDYAREAYEAFDIVTARAVARLSVLLEYSLPFIKVDGFFIALKGPELDNEINESKYALDILGGEIQNVFDFNIESEYEKFSRRILIVKKISKTPEKYPRKSGIPIKRPILEKK